MDMEMMGELVAALEQIEAIPEISTTVFAGSERAFSAASILRHMLPTLCAIC